MNSLDLYAKIEPYIGFYKEYERLYRVYIERLNSLHVKECLDIGCGNGKFLQLLQQNGFDAFGIDRSKEMIKRAKKLGVKAENSELFDLQTNSFEAAVAIGDVLNYMQKEELNSFFANLHRVLKKEGYFLADINTLYGFEEITAGIFIKDTKDLFLSIEADFEDEILDTKITLFEREEECFKRYSDYIEQYYHALDVFKTIEGFTLVSVENISMFSEEADKNLLIFQRI